MSYRKYEKINHKTGNKVTTHVTQNGRQKHVQRILQKSDGILGTRFLGTTKVLTNRTTTR